MTRMHVQGVLTPSSTKSVNEATADRMDAEMARNQLVPILRNLADWDILQWKMGIVKVDSFTETLGGCPAAMDFITRLYMFVTAPGIKELDLQGEMMVTFDGARGPVIFRVTVANGNVFYNEATVTWENEPIAFM